MRQKRQFLQRQMLCFLCICVWMFTGCTEQAESVSLTKAEIREETDGDDTVEVSQNTDLDTKEEATGVDQIQTTDDIYVYVCGEVKHPGVYPLEAGSRITHAIEAAGGMTSKAADSYLNQAEVLTDGQKIYVPNQKEAEQTALPETASTGGQAETNDGKININTADKSQLTQLNGIGDSRAEAIISYRESKGAFQSIEEIKNVDGIKDGIFSKIKEQIKVE